MEFNLKKENFFDLGDKYFVEFNYENKDQQEKIYQLFEKALNTCYGANSNRAMDGKDYIMPYFVDELGNFTVENTGKIGGTSIPEDLLPEFIRRFVEVDGAIVKVGNSQIKGQFDYDYFNEIISNIGINKSK